MRIISFTVFQKGEIVGKVPIREQARNAAKIRAERTGDPVSVVAELDNGKKREVVFYPDGTVDKIWEKEAAQ